MTVVMIGLIAGLVARVVLDAVDVYRYHRGR